MFNSYFELPGGMLNYRVVFFIFSTIQMTFTYFLPFSYIVIQLDVAVIQLDITLCWHKSNDIVLGELLHVCCLIPGSNRTLLIRLIGSSPGVISSQPCETHI